MHGLDEEVLQPTLSAAWILGGGAMLRVEINDSVNSVRLKFEGRLAGEDARNTRTLLTRWSDGMALVIDLTEVTFIDSVGEEVLSLFGRFGAKFVAETSYALDVCERLRLHLTHNGVSKPNLSDASRPNAHRRKPTKKS